MTEISELPEGALPLDIDEDLVAPFRHMREDRRDEIFVVEGELPVGRLLSAAPRFEVGCVVCTEARAERLAARLPAGVPMRVGVHAQLRELAGFDFHRGALAWAHRPAVVGMSELVQRRFVQKQRLLGVMAHGLADPSNLGALVRNARAFGADFVAIHAEAADPYAPRAIRASAGQVFELTCFVYEDGEATADILREQIRCTLIAATLSDKAASLRRIDPPRRAVLCVGNEGGGLPATLLAKADMEVTIPMAKGVDSLNVAAATAVMLYGLTDDPPDDAPA